MQQQQQQQQQRLARKTFNSVASAFFREIGKIFPSDAKLIFLNEELKRFTKDKTKDHIPAMQFFKAMNVPTGMTSLAEGGGDAVIGELILNHDDRLFAPECKAEVPQLNALDFKQKWLVLSPENRQFVWGYLDRMAQLSAKVAALQIVDSSEVMELLSAVTQVTNKLPPNQDERATIETVMTDPTVSTLTKELTNKIYNSS